MKKKTVFILLITVFLVLENIVLLFVADFNYQYQTQDRIAISKTGQAKACQAVPVGSDLFFVLEKMSLYSPDSVYTDSVRQIHLYYGSEIRGFVTAAGVGFTLDRNYRLISKGCEGKQEPEPEILR